MKNLCFSALFCFLFFGAAISQETFVVISTNGLKLRETPDRNGRVLAVAPFGAKVQVLTRQTGEHDYVIYDPPARRDTIGKLFPVRYNSGAGLHIGYWWKVRYGGKSGYMFNGFLADSSMLQNSDRKELNNNFRLRNTDGNAGATNNPEFGPNWHWYGLFLQQDSLFALKKVEPQYAVVYFTDSVGGYNFYDKAIVIQTAPPEKPLFIVGTRTAWKERSGFEGCWQENNPLEQFILATGEIDPVFMKKHHIEVIREKKVRQGYRPEEWLAWYITDKNGRKQRVAPLKTYQDYEEPPSTLLWEGDLDGDGKPDFIFTANGELGYFVLYLSSQAGKGEVAKPVAVLWTWYTC